MNKRQPPDDEGEFDLPGMRDLPTIPDLALPAVGLGPATMPSLGISLPEQRLAGLPDLGQLSLKNLALDFTNPGVARGRPYTPVLVIGQAGQPGTPLGIPFGVARLPDNTICVADFMDDGGQARLQVFDNSGNLVRLIRQFELGDGQAAFDTPAAIVADAQGGLYLADMEMNCIKHVAPDGKVLAVLGAEGMKEHQLKAPQGIALDASGNLYIADSGNSRILKWDQQGRCLLILGINQPDEDGDYLLAGEALGEFDEPRGVAVDAAGNILVADTNNHRVQQFGPAGNFLHTFGEEGEEAGQLSFPERIQVDAAGSIYVSDLNGGRIQKFDASSRFVYELVLPKDAGTLVDFRVDSEGRLLVALRKSRLVLELDVA